MKTDDLPQTFVTELNGYIVRNLQGGKVAVSNQSSSSQQGFFTASNNNNAIMASAKKHAAFSLTQGQDSSGIFYTVTVAYSFMVQKLFLATEPTKFNTEPRGPSSHNYLIRIKALFKQYKMDPSTPFFLVAWYV